MASSRPTFASRTASSSPSSGLELRQVDDAVHAGRHLRADRRRDPLRRRGGQRGRGARPECRHRLPVLRALSKHDGAGQHPLSAAASRTSARHEAARRAEAMAALVQVSDLLDRASVADVGRRSNSGSRSPAPWSRQPAFFFSTSRCPISTRASASPCAARSAACSGASASPPSSSPTTRSRRRRWPTASSACSRPDRADRHRRHALPPSRTACSSPGSSARRPSTSSPAKAANGGLRVGEVSLPFGNARPGKITLGVRPEAVRLGDTGHAAKIGTTSSRTAARPSTTSPRPSARPGAGGRHRRPASGLATRSGSTSSGRSVFDGEGRRLGDTTAPLPHEPQGPATQVAHGAAAAGRPGLPPPQISSPASMRGRRSRSTSCSPPTVDFVCLHDLTLDAETTGTGPVASAHARRPRRAFASAGLTALCSMTRRCSSTKWSPPLPVITVPTAAWCSST